ncbi:MAG: MBG domain-containing protein, partial [Anaeroplasmataceae bacterium]
GSDVGNASYDLINNLVFNDVLPVTISINANKYSLPNHYGFLFTDSTNSNYEISYLNKEEKLHEITHFIINVNVDDATSTYGEVVSNIPYNSNAPLDVNINLVITHEITQSSKPGVYEYEVNYIDVEGYKINVTKGKYTVLKRKISVNVNAFESIYGSNEDTYKLDYAILDGSIYNNDVLFTLTSKANKKSIVGIYEIVISNKHDCYDIDVKNSNFNLHTITKRDLVITVNESNSIYGNQVNLSFITSEIFNNDELDIKFVTELDAKSKVGKYLLEISTNDNSNYSIEIKQAYHTITKREISLEILEQSSEYGDDIKEVEYNLNGVINNDSLEINLSHDAKSNSSVVNGKYLITHINNEYENYIVTSNTAYYTIVRRKISVEILPSSSKQGTEVGEALYSINKNIVENDSIPFLIVINANKDSEPGFYGFTCTDLNNPNYEIIFENEDALIHTVLSKDSITIIINDVSIVYGSKVTEPTYEVNGEEPKGLDIELKYDVTSKTNVGKYTISAVFNEIPGYIVNVIEATYTVSQRDVTINIKKETTVYGEKLENITYTIYSGFVVNNDKLINIITTANEKSFVGEYTYEITYYNTNYNITILNDVDNTLIVHEIVQMNIRIDIDDQSSDYKKELKPLKYSIINDGKFMFDDINDFIIKSDADKNKPGNYDIFIIFENENYNISYDKGVYTVLSATSEYVANIINDSYEFVNSQITYDFNDVMLLEIIQELVKDEALLSWKEDTFFYEKGTTENLGSIGGTLVIKLNETRSTSEVEVTYEAPMAEQVPSSGSSNSNTTLIVVIVIIIISLILVAATVVTVILVRRRNRF